MPGCPTVSLPGIAFARAISSLTSRTGEAALTVIPGVPESIEASVQAFHVGVGVCAALIALGGVLGLLGIRNPRREVRCEDCAAGAHVLHAPPSNLAERAVAQ